MSVKKNESQVIENDDQTTKKPSSKNIELNDKQPFLESEGLTYWVIGFKRKSQ